jgi:UDP-glucose 6-dehydrogenase
VPCVTEPSDIFEIEKTTKGIWRYRLKNTDEWIESMALDLLKSLDQNDVNLGFFKQQLANTILVSATQSYEVFQQACNLLGEEAIYSKIEEEYSRDNEEE